MWSSGKSKLKDWAEVVTVTMPTHLRLFFTTGLGLSAQMGKEGNGGGKCKKGAAGNAPDIS